VEGWVTSRLFRVDFTLSSYRVQEYDYEQIKEQGIRELRERYHIKYSEEYTEHITEVVFLHFQLKISILKI